MIGDMTITWIIHTEVDARELHDTAAIIAIFALHVLQS